MELQGVVSKLDIVLYDILQLSTTNTAGSYNFFSKAQATAGKERTSLPQPNLIPQNWKSFTIQAIGMKVLDFVDRDAFLSFVANSHYVFKIADYEIKQGHLSEFFNVSALVYASPPTTANVYEITTTGQVDYPNNNFVSLMKPIVLEPLVSFQFIVNVATDIVGMRGAFVGLYFKGVLDRSIVG